MWFYNVLCHGDSQYVGRTFQRLRTGSRAILGRGQRGQYLLRFLIGPGLARGHRDIQGLSLGFRQNNDVTGVGHCCDASLAMGEFAAREM